LAIEGDEAELYGALVWRVVAVGHEDDTDVHGVLRGSRSRERDGNGPPDRGVGRQETQWVPYPLLVVLCSIGTAVRLEELVGTEFDGSNGWQSLAKQWEDPEDARLQIDGLVGFKEHHGGWEAEEEKRGSPEEEIEAAALSAYMRRQGLRLTRGAYWSNTALTSSTSANRVSKPAQDGFWTVLDSSGGQERRKVVQGVMWTRHFVQGSKMDFFLYNKPYRTTTWVNLPIGE
jgi:hypothetical protein